MRLLRCLRLDDTDDNIYPRCAEGGEWVVPGTFTFTFTDRDPATLEDGEREAFRRAFLGLNSFGWTTLAVVAEISEVEHRQLLERLARHFVDNYGAPGLEAAMDEARRELAFAESLAEAEVNTILSVERSIDDDGVSEQFRTHRPREGADWEGAARPIKFVPESIG